MKSGSSDSDSEEDQDDVTGEEDPSKERLVYRVGPKGKIRLLSGVDEVSCFYWK